jgi:hypothetical protein
MCPNWFEWLASLAILSESGSSYPVKARFDAATEWKRETNLSFASVSCSSLSSGRGWAAFGTAPGSVVIAVELLRKWKPKSSTDLCSENTLQ